MEGTDPTSGETFARSCKPVRLPPGNMPYEIVQIFPLGDLDHQPGIGDLYGVWIPQTQSLFISIKPPLRVGE